MENQYNSLIKEFESNVKLIINERNSLKSENQQLHAELERKKEDLMAAHKDILELREELRLSQTAGGMSGSAESRENSRQHLNKLVREIDKCLALLREWAYE